MLNAGYHHLPPGQLAMVVTYLEMRMPAPLRGVACPPGVRLARFPRDLDAYLALFRRVGEDWLWSSRLELRREELSDILTDPDVHLYALVAEGAPQAILELDFREAGQCELAFFGLAAPLIGTGAGAYLMDCAIDLAWKQDITRFHLHTCTLDSPQALDFYIRSGFRPYKRAVEIAEDPRVTGLLPKSAAPHIPLL